jgi:hypothetical protein
VEGLNRVIMNLLKHELAGADEQFWDLYLGLITMIYNSSIHSKTGASPFMMMFGKEMGNVVPVVDLEHPMITEDYLRHLRQAQELHWNAVRANQEAELAKRKEAANISHSFKAGDFVLVRKHSGNARGQNKLGAKAHKWRGPYRILKTYPGCLLVMPYQVGSSLIEKDDADSEANGMNPDLDVESSSSRLKQDVVPVQDCKPYHGMIPPVPIINVKRAREVLRLLEVDTALMDGPEGNAEFPAVRDLGPLNITDEMLATSDSTVQAPEDVTTAEHRVQRPRGRPRKDVAHSPLVNEAECNKQSNPPAQAAGDGRQVVKLPLEGEKPLGRTRSATRLLGQQAS